MQLQQAVERLDYSRDQVTIFFGGDQENMAEGFGSLFLAMGLSVLFVYIVLASQFGSFAQPFVIMLAMPFSFMGAFAALRLAGMALDITGLIGLIMLMGLVVKNSILLVDFTNKLRADGLERHEAIARAGAIRLRPILMTSAAIIAGAVPTALGIHFLSNGSGAEFRRGLAVVLIGGMVTSTLLTLLVVPTAYSLLDSAVSRLGRRRAAPEPTAAPAATTD
jgi:HAE1 family hydrophobic/amphiphilic exporter-1